MASTVSAVCPKCQHLRATPRDTLVLNNTSVLVISCSNCGHTWSMTLAHAKGEKLAAPLDND
jgi:transcription elongation factor Elf1